MASRNRPRGGMKDEERDMWNQILADIKRAKAINLRCAETSKLIVALESAMSKCMYKTLLNPTIGLCFLCIAGTFLRCGSSATTDTVSVSPKAKEISFVGLG